MRASHVSRPAVLLTVSHAKTLLPIEVVTVGVTEKTMSLSNHLGLLGRKVGMMRLFTDDGDAVPVTVVDVSNNLSLIHISEPTRPY